MSDIDEDQLKSPITCIPPELLSIIFMTYLKASRPIDRDETNPRLALLTIASVCHLWREVACSTAELWSTCWLNYKHPELNKLWLARSGTQMLDLDGGLVFRDQWGEYLREPSLDPFLESIAPYMHRCQTLSIDPDYLSEPKLPIPELPTPNLISCKIDGQTCPPWLSHMVSAGIQNLQSLNLVLSEQLFDEIRLDSGLPNIVDLSLGFVAHADHFYLVLIKSPKLQTLVIRQPILHWPPNPPHPIIHGTLTRLDLQFFKIFDIPRLLDTLTFPSLRVLAVHIHIYGRPSQHEEDGHVLPLLELFQRSQCAIKELAIKIKGYGSLIPILQNLAVFPSLEILAYNSATITDQLLLFLAQPSNLPRLRKISFDEVACHNKVLMADMVRDRRGGGGQEQRSHLEVFELSLAFGDHRYNESEEREGFVKMRNSIRDLAKSSLDGKVPLTAEVSRGGLGAFRIS